MVPALSSWRRRRAEESALDGWRYRVTWKQLAEPGRATLRGTWLVVAPSGVDASEVSEVRAALDRAGADVRTLQVEDTVDVAAVSRFGELSGVVSLLALAESPHAEATAVPVGITATVTLIQALAKIGVAAPVWAVTRGAVSVGGADRLTNPVQAQVWGLGRAAALEHPDRWGGLVDLPEHVDDTAKARFVAVLAGHDGEDQVALRPSGVFGRRLVRAGQGLTAGSPWTPRGTVLVTEGVTGTGAHVARWLARRGAERLVLLTAHAADSTTLLAELAELGAEATVEVCDVADRDALAAVVERHPVTGVVHCAGMLHETALDELTVAELADAMTARVGGAANLHAVLADAPLDAFVLFSSVAGVWGSGRQAAYGAANAYVDALAVHRRSAGLPATSIAWGPWAEGGAGESELRRMGLIALPLDGAFEALSRTLDTGEVTVSIADLDWEAFVPRFTSVRPSALLADLPEAQRVLDAADAAVNTGQSGALADRLAGLGSDEQRALVLEVVRSAVAHVLGHASMDAVGADSAFADLGFDSLTAVELRNRLAADTGRKLSATLVFDYPTPEALADHLHGALAPSEPTRPTSVLDELTRLETLFADLTPDALATVAADEETRADITARLKSLVSRWQDVRQQAGGDDTAAGDIESATDDELFALIERKIGRA